MTCDERVSSGEIGDAEESECVGLDGWEEKSEGEQVGNVDSMGSTNLEAKVAAKYISRQTFAALPIQPTDLYQKPGETGNRDAKERDAADD